MAQQQTPESETQASGRKMRFAIAPAAGYLRADLYDRTTAEETREFLSALTARALATGADRVLISVHSSRALFRVQQFGLAELFEVAASRPGHRVALVADDLPVRLSQQYVSTLAKIRGLHVESFGSERQAIAWLSA